jgi:hypothetical protein
MNSIPVKALIRRRLTAWLKAHEQYDDYGCDDGQCGEEKGN